MMMVPGGGCNAAVPAAATGEPPQPSANLSSPPPLMFQTAAYGGGQLFNADCYDYCGNSHYFNNLHRQHTDLDHRHHQLVGGQHNRYNNTHCMTPSAVLSPASLPPVSPPDNNNYHMDSYFHHQNNNNNNNNVSLSSVSSSSSSPSSFSSSSSSSSLSPASGFVTQNYDCHGVPVHPSVTDYPPSTNCLQYNIPYGQQLVTAMPPPPLQPQRITDYPSSSSYESLDFPKSTVYNSNREQRNLAEKKRRNKLNTCINELSKLVPFISNFSKKIEKTGVLRLSAAYLRLNRVLMGLKEQREELPSYINKVNLAELMLGDRDIFLMVTSAGKIVFVSHSVENILGHSQIDLMGQSIYYITCPEDHDELKNNLKYQYETSSSNVINTNDTTLNTNNESNSSRTVQRRSFYIRLVKKAVSRNEKPEFELVHVMGTLVLQNSETKSSLLGGNNIILNAIVRPYNERRVTEISLLEASKEEYITRHQIDGLIIYVDHRISIVSGFMPQEVSGQSAFSFMHKDDVRWVMIALRQMFFKGQSFGSSCYRLLSKNGEFVYMKTYGYLELNLDEESIVSFICVNTLIDEEEGKREILKMKKKFTPLIKAPDEPGIAAITNHQSMETTDETSSSWENPSTEDPKTLNRVVEQMIINIPAPAIDNVKETAQNPGPLEDSQYVKVALLSKSMPPVSVTSNAPKIAKRSSLSPQLISKPPTQDRPSVLRVAPPVARCPVVVSNQQINGNSAENDREYYERRGGILVVPKRHNDLQLVEQSSKKAKITIETEIDSPAYSQCSNPMDGSHSDHHLSTDGYCSLDDFTSYQDTPIPFSSHNDDNIIDLDNFTDVNMASLDNFSKTFDDNDSSINPLVLTPESYNSYDTGVYDEGNPTDIQDPIIHVLQHDVNLKSDLLEKKQITLKSKMDQQQGQLKEIQSELDSLSSNADTHFLTTNFSNLKAVHEKQQQMLRKLQGVHKNIGV